MVMKKVIAELEHYINTREAHYYDLHEQLNEHRGKPLEETNLAEVHKIIDDIQDTYAELYNIYSFINRRYSPMINFMKAHQELLDSLIQAGAKATDSTHYEMD